MKQTDNAVTNSVSFVIQGMDCADEVAILKRDLGPLVGGAERLSFDILNKRMTVTVQRNSPSIDTFLQAIRTAGFQGEVWNSHHHGNEQRHSSMARTAITGVSGLLLLAAFASHVLLNGNVLSAFGQGSVHAIKTIPTLARVLYAAAVLSGIWFTVPKAWRALRRLSPDMNLLMVIAVCGAIAIGEWLEAATVSFLFAVSLALESWSVDRARRAVAALMSIVPTTVHVMRDDDSELEMAPSQVAIGTKFLVRPGEHVPLDGEVIAGSSEINQAPITGESVGVFKQVGDQVYAGTINGNGALDVVSTKPAQDSTLARIARMVGEAQSRRAPTEQWVDRFARYYTPAVLFLALAVFLIPPLMFDQSWSGWTYRALVLLVIACPCALVISTPVSIVAALTAAARNGVLIKGGVYVEEPARLRAIAFDKTGTITEGRPVVQSVVPLSGHTELELLEIAASIEAKSSHPLARAILSAAESRGIQLRPVLDFQTVQGKGATATLDGRNVWVGSHRHLEERGQETTELHIRLEQLTAGGMSAVVVGEDDHVCGVIVIADQIRSNAKNTIEELRSAGIKHVIMLTGDNRATGDSVGQRVHVDEVLAELLPHQKVDAIERLVKQFEHVAMVGDGVNDSPALARATLGIAMGAAGTDAAIETADIALMTDDLSRLPWLIHHSRRTLTIIRQNIIASLSVKALFVVLTFMGHASLWAAIAADTGASLAVVLNGLRLLRVHGNQVDRSA